MPRIDMSKKRALSRVLIGVGTSQLALTAVAEQFNLWTLPTFLAFSFHRYNEFWSSLSILIIFEYIWIHIIIYL